MRSSRLLGLLLGGGILDLLRGRATFYSQQLVRLDVVGGLVELATALRLYFGLLGNCQ